MRPGKAEKLGTQKEVRQFRRLLTCIFFLLMPIAVIEHIVAATNAKAAETVVRAVEEVGGKVRWVSH